MTFWMAVFNGMNLADNPPQGIPDWVWIILVVFVVFLAFGVYMRLQGKSVVQPEKDVVSAAVEPRSSPHPVPTSAPAPEPTSPPPAPAPAPEITPPPPAPAKPDDLVIIEGIGPKIAGVLNSAGITTFAALAAATPARLNEIMRSSGLRVPADPATWPAQAALAAAGQWDELKKLQNNLKGGRQV